MDFGGFWRKDKNDIEKGGGFWYNEFVKYEQTVNSPFLGRKKLIVRIFCELHVKMGSGSRCLCGFPDPTVEMREARFRALTQPGWLRQEFHLPVEMREARFRALTPRIQLFNRAACFPVEMREARFRALAHTLFLASLALFLRRNGRDPL